jgi:hypothetical protein
MNSAALEALKGEPIPYEHIFPIWQEEYTETYITRPCLIQYSGEDPSAIPNLFAQEIRVMEILAKHPHPNVVTYYGCARDGQYVTGICLKKYICTLSDLIRGKVPEDK